MTISPGVLYGLTALALASGPICSGIQWHHWNDKLRHRRKRTRPASDREGEKSEA